jgi:hypothetical protein
MDVGSEDVGNAVLVTIDIDRCFKAGQVQVAVGLREGPPDNQKPNDPSYDSNN